MRSFVIYFVGSVGAGTVAVGLHWSLEACIGLLLVYNGIVFAIDKD